MSPKSNSLLGNLPFISSTSICQGRWAGSFLETLTFAFKSPREKRNTPIHLLPGKTRILPCFVKCPQGKTWWVASDCMPGKGGAGCTCLPSLHRWNVSQKMKYPSLKPQCHVWCPFPPEREGSQSLTQFPEPGRLCNDWMPPLFYILFLSLKMYTFIQCMLIIFIHYHQLLLVPLLHLPSRFMFSFSLF